MLESRQGTGIVQTTNTYRNIGQNSQLYSTYDGTFPSEKNLHPVSRVQSLQNIPRNLSTNNSGMNLKSEEENHDSSFVGIEII